MTVAVRKAIVTAELSRHLIAVSQHAFQGQVKEAVIS